MKAGILDDPARRANMLFGGGRRVCPGIAFAKSSLVCLTYLILLSGLPLITRNSGNQHREPYLGIRVPPRRRFSDW